MGGGNSYLFILTWIIVIVGVIVMLKLLLQKDKPLEDKPLEDKPLEEEKSELELAKIRYEKGEITEEEFEEIRKRLS